eukprot:COSAG04_NODE_463_length_13963_cov_7.207588_4_plen_47_part_00
MLLGGLSAADDVNHRSKLGQGEKVVSDGGAMTGSVQVVSPVWTLAQ